MKKHSIVMLVGMIVAVAAVFLVLHDTPTGRRFSQSEAPLSTPEKFHLLARWLPADADVLVVVDLSRARLLPVLEQVFREQDMPLTLLHDQVLTVGMAAGVLSMSEGTEGFLLILQGTFDDQQIQDALEEAKSSNEETFFGKRLDDHHFAVGSPALLEKVVAHASTETPLSALADTPLFGSIRFSPRLTAGWPPRIASLPGAHFSSVDGTAVQVLLATESPAQAQDVELLLAGMKALLLLEREGEARLVRALETVRIASHDNTVRLEVPTESLMQLRAY